MKKDSESLVRINSRIKQWQYEKIKKYAKSHDVGEAKALRELLDLIFPQK